MIDTYLIGAQKYRLVKNCLFSRDESQIHHNFLVVS